MVITDFENISLAKMANLILGEITTLLLYM